MNGQTNFGFESGDQLACSCRFEQPGHIFQAQYMSARIAQLFDRFTTVVERAAQSSAPRLVIEMGLLELVHAAPMKPLGELVERLRALEQGGEARGPRETAPAGRNATGAAPNAGRPPVTKADNIEKTTPGRLADSIRRDQPKLRPQAGSSPGGAKATDDKNPYWKMLGMDPESSQAPERQDPPPSTQPNQQEAPRRGEVPSATPRESDANFQLDGRPVTPSPHADGVRIEDDASAGCPSSRCTPKPAIPWREMEPLPVWESLVSALADEDSFAHAVFNDMGFVGLTEECLTLACPKNSFVWQQFSETPQLAQHLRRNRKYYLVTIFFYPPNHTSLYSIPMQLSATQPKSEFGKNKK